MGVQPGGRLSSSHAGAQGLCSCKYDSVEGCAVEEVECSVFGDGLFGV